MISFSKSMGVEAFAQKAATFTSPFADFSQEELAQVLSFHQSIAEYQPTPLQNLTSLAKRLNVAGVYVKDESYRMGLNAYKGMGGLYAVAKVICKELGFNLVDTSFSDLKKPEILNRIHEMTFVTATDGNHGNGLAWSAAQFGCRSVVYMPKGSSQSRAQNIRQSGASHVEITDLLYDDAVRFAAATALEKGWIFVQDTALEGYTEIPIWIAQGYTTMAVEAYSQLEKMGLPNPTHVFLQAGVGSMASALTAYLYNRFPEHRPVISIVEPDTIACIYHSMRWGDGKPHGISTESKTIMAGLNCGEPSLTAWPILRDVPSHYIACEDFVAARGMRILGHPTGSDPQVISGESGAVGAGLLSLLMEKPTLQPLRDSLGLDQSSSVLLINTEGNTDPVMYDKIIYDGYCPSPE